MTNYQSGVRVERKAVQFLANHGYVAMRSAGSKGAFDVIGINEQGIRFIQCKSSSETISKSMIKRVGNDIAALYYHIFGEGESVLSGHVFFELWAHESGKGFVRCMVAGVPNDSLEFPEGVELVYV